MFPQLGAHFLAVPFIFALLLWSHCSLGLILSTNSMIRLDRWNGWWLWRPWVLVSDLWLIAFASNLTYSRATILALLDYDYFLTLGSEIEGFWKRRFYYRLTWSSFLFFANRYLAPLGYIPIALELFNQTEINPTVSVVIPLLFHIQCIFWRVELF
jgi:hypothetical protein